MQGTGPHGGYTKEELEQLATSPFYGWARELAAQMLQVTSRIDELGKRIDEKTFTKGPE